MKTKLDLNLKTVLITGAAGFIGAADSAHPSEVEGDMRDWPG